VPPHLPSALLLRRRLRVASGNGLSTGLSTTIKCVRRTTSGAAGNGLGTTIKYLRRKRNGTAGNGLGTTTKYTSAGNRLAATIKYLHGAAGIGLGTTIKYHAQCLCVLKMIIPHKKTNKQSRIT
jgi:hypothetical protein